MPNYSKDDITLRADKSGPLTHSELDINFQVVKQHVDQIANINTQLNSQIANANSGGSIDLSGYVTDAEFSTTLDAYTTQASLSGQLSGYATQGDISGFITASSLSEYATTASVSSQLSAYATTASLSNYATITSVSSQLSQYATTASVTSQLNSFATTSYVQGVLDDYATVEDLANYSTPAMVNFVISTKDISDFTDNNGLLNTFSGSYNDLADKPSIPSLAGYATEAYVAQAVVNASGGNVDLSGYATTVDLNNAIAGIGDNFSGDYNDLTNKPTIPSIAGLASTNYVDTAVAAVSAFSGSYDDLTNKPTIPTVPTKLSDFTNDVPFATVDQAIALGQQFVAADDVITTNYQAADAAVTASFLEADAATLVAANQYTDNAVITSLASLVDSAPAALNTLNELAAALGDDPNFATTVNNNIASKLPLSGGTMTGDLTLNGAPTNANHAANKGYVDAAVAAIDTSADLTNYYTKTEVNGLIPTTFSGDYNDLTNKPTIPTVPTNVSAFTNDAGYITSAAVFSGDYADLTNKPTIPTDINQLNDVNNLLSGASSSQTAGVVNITGVAPTDHIDINETGNTTSSDGLNLLKFTNGTLVSDSQIPGILNSEALSASWDPIAGSKYNAKFGINTIRSNSSDILRYMVGLPWSGSGDTTIIGNINKTSDAVQLIAGMGINGPNVNIQTIDNGQLNAQAHIINLSTREEDNSTSGSSISINTNEITLRGPLTFENNDDAPLVASTQDAIYSHQNGLYNTNRELNKVHLAMFWGMTSGQIVSRVIQPDYTNPQEAIMVNKLLEFSTAKGHRWIDIDPNYGAVDRAIRDIYIDRNGDGKVVLAGWRSHGIEPGTAIVVHNAGSSVELTGNTYYAGGYSSGSTTANVVLYTDEALTTLLDPATVTAFTNPTGWEYFNVPTGTSPITPSDGLEMIKLAMDFKSGQTEWTDGVSIASEYTWGLWDAFETVIKAEWDEYKNALFTYEYQNVAYTDLSIWDNTQHLGDHVGSGNVSIGNGDNGLIIQTKVPESSIGAEYDVAGMVAFDDAYIYRCVADYTDGTVDIWKRVALTGGSW